MYSQVRNSSGFSLIEILISVAAIAILAVGAAQISADLIKTSVSADASQQRTNIDQSLNAVFENSEICTVILTGVAAENGAAVTLPQSLHILDALKKITLEKMQLSDVQSLGNNNYRASIEVQGLKKGPAGGTEVFDDKIPVYFLATSGKVTNCFSEKSAYATCLALNGVWKETYCDFCASLGGTRNASGKCSIAAAAPPKPPIPIPNSKFTVLRVASGYNGVRTHNLGSYRQCNLTSYNYDGDGIGECSVFQSGGTWQVTVGDEGTRHPQICYMACVYNSAVDSATGDEDGDVCMRAGRSGVMTGGCCAIGSQFRVNYTTIGFGKNQSRNYTGTTDNVGCVK